MREILAISLLAILGGCQTVPSYHPPPQMESVSLIHKGDAIEMEHAEDFIERASKGTIVGGVAGATGGAIVASAACGPAAFLCLPTFLMLGMYSGAAGGSLFGFTGLSPASAAKFNSALMDITGSGKLGAHLAQGLEAELPDLWSPLEHSKVKMLVLVDQIKIEQHLLGKVGLDVVASMNFQWLNEDRETLISKVQYRAASARHAPDEWLANDAARLNEELRSLLKGIQESMVKRLRTMQSKSYD